MSSTFTSLLHKSAQLNIMPSRMGIIKNEGNYEVKLNRF
jgi:hypothetical protein